MHNYNVLMTYYIRYLKEIRKVSDSTVNHYLGALRTISRYLVEHSKIRESVFEISELSELEIIKEYLYSQPDFVDKDERGNRMYSAGLNNYLRFANGEVFCSPDVVATQMDVAISLDSGRNVITVERWKRNGIIKKQSIEMAQYKCEFDPRHNTFTAASSQHQYMEGHHAVPIKQQNHFDVSLDVYANIVCLCPICHRLLHYGVDEEKQVVLDKIYYERADRLAGSGIVISKDEFTEMAV